MITASVRQTNLILHEAQHVDKWHVNKQHCGITIQTSALSNEAFVELLTSTAAAQDRVAFAKLFQHFGPKLKSFALRRGDSDAVAEELAQETMLTVWRKAATFDREKASVSTWIFTIARNKRIDLHRRKSFMEIDLGDSNNLAETEADQDRQPDEHVEAVQNRTIVHDALSHLPDPQKQVLTKAFFDEKSHSEIADELGLPLGTVKSRIRLALSKLRGLVTEHVQ